MSEMRAERIAPCGMNCRLCIGFIREKKPCAGCNGDDTNKPYHCVVCKIKNCEGIQTVPSGLCDACEKKCRRLKDLDKRYKMKYHMSMLENLAYIKENGMPAFLKREEERWTCPACSGIVSVHRNECPACGHVVFESVT